jgi:PAS domain S-box-containing protein
VAHAREGHEQLSGAFEQLQAVVAALPDGVLGIDGEGHITFANRGAARLTGRSELDLVGLWLAELAVELGSETQTWERALAASTIERHAALFKRAGGTDKVQLTVVPVGPGGPFNRLIVMAAGE